MIEKKPFEQIQTERLILKPHEVSFDYATLVFNAIKKDCFFLIRFLDKMLSVKTPEDEYSFFVNCQEAWHKMQRAEYGIWKKEASFIGTCAVVNIDYEHHSGEIVYWLAQEETGKGFMIEAVKALEKNFYARGFNRLTIVMDEENIASENVAKQCGYSREGIMRHWHYNPTLRSWRNMCLYSKLKSEWENQK